MSIQYTVDQLQHKFSGPSGSSGFARLGERLRTDGRLDEAIQICQDGLRLRPSHLTGHLVLGKSLVDAGRADEAREQFETALRLDSRCLSAMRCLADIMNSLKMEEVAVGYYRSILEVEPWDAEIRALLDNASSNSQSYSHSAPMAHASEDTYQKPGDLTGDVLEINLNEVSDFLPSEDAEMLLVPASETPSIEVEPQQESMIASDVITAAASDLELKAPVTEPDQVDLKDSEATEAVPITGLDVEDRMDELFGSLDGLPQVESGTAQVANPTEMIEVTQALPPEKDRVLGEDIEKRLDDLFSLNDEASPPAEISLKPADMPDSAGPENGVLETSLPETGDFKIDDLASATETSDSIMSTESMLPVGWLAETGDQPPITGADIEAQLDKLFELDEPPATAANITRDADNPKDLTIQEEQFLAKGKAEDFIDQTLTFPSLQDAESKSPASDWQAGLGKETPSSQTASAELLRESAETMMLPTEETGSATDLDLAPDFDATLEFSLPDSKAPVIDAEIPTASEGESLTETTSMEMVDGADIANRLDELFQEEGSNTEAMGTETMAAETMGMEATTPETMGTGTMETSGSDTIVTGEEVSKRLSEIFEKPESAPTGLKTTPTAPAPNLVPLIDEEDAYPEEEENASQSEGGANVATVTLAEIYFQQGLREQALQIYRQLLELEPGNASVRSRIAEIEQSGENPGSGGPGSAGQGPAGQRPGGQGPDSDQRRPRPGFKIPKRKK